MKRILLSTVTLGLAAGAVAGCVNLDEKLITGVVASYGNFPKTGAIDVTQTDAAPGDATSPVTGSISRKGTDQCVAVLKNGSKDNGYSVSFEVIGADANGNASFKRNFSASLSPGASTTRSFSCRKDLYFAVVLKSGRKL